MATWIAHLRIAEKILNTLALDEEGFILGSLAPDCNKANEDWSAFDPPQPITHWIGADGDPVGQDFLRVHYKKDLGRKAKSFLLGYYAHLHTDLKWKYMWRQIKSQDNSFWKNTRERLQEDPSFLWKIKEDWYGHDFDYLRTHKSNIFVDVFLKAKLEESYLEYFPASIMQEKITYIKNYYQDPKEDLHLTSYRYLTREQMDTFIEEVSRVLTHQIEELL